MLELTTLTTIINLIALAASLALGLYIITRSPHSTLSRLAAFLLWSADAYFFSNTLWNNLKSNIWVAWILQAALLVAPLIPHISMKLFVKINQRRTRLDTINAVAIPFLYVITFVLILCGVLPSSPPVGLFNPGTEIMPDPVPLGYVSHTSSPVYPVFIAVVILSSVLALANLWRARQQVHDASLHRTLSAFIVAVVVAACGILYSSLGTWLRLDAPTFPSDILFGISIFLVGYAVARHAALLEGRWMDRDFLYALLGVGAFTIVYGLIGWLLYLANQISFVAFVFVIIGAIAASSIIDGARITLDRIFYQGQFQKLRSNLRSLAREAGTRETLSERLQAILDSLCHTYQIEKGFIAVASPTDWLTQATHQAHPLNHRFALALLTAPESIGLVHSDQKELTGMKLLIPLFAGGRQLGALVLGDKLSKQPYSDKDLELLEDLSDQMAGVIQRVQAQEENAQSIAQVVQEFQDKERALQLQMQSILVAPREQKSANDQLDAENLIPQVEDALRKLHDCAYLGEHSLAKLTIVEKCLEERADQDKGFIERGKALSTILIQALNHLRPQETPPSKTATPSREWYPYIILHNSYVLDEPNRDIMSRLYISEGTFNRTRRRALANVAKTLIEMEQGVTN